MRGASMSLPAMLRAGKVLKRLDQACRKSESVQEAAAALKDSVETLTGTADPETALGEVLMKLSAVARTMKVDPEIALNAATDRLIDRFEKIENEAAASGAEWDSLTEDVLEKYWFLVKLSGEAR